MELQHGTDNIESVEAFKNHTAKGGWYHDDYDYAKDAGLDPNNVIYLANNANHYAEVALIIIEVPESQVVQVSDDEYVMSPDADYKVVSVIYQNTSTLPRIGNAR